MTDAGLAPQPDDDVPRFDYEGHIRSLVDDRIWPDSTRRISELRLTIRFESASFLSRSIGRGRLHLDIVDYPGEWLLDLPLLVQGFFDLVARGGGAREDTGPGGLRRRLARAALDR